MATLTRSLQLLLEILEIRARTLIGPNNDKEAIKELPTLQALDNLLNSELDRLRIDIKYGNNIDFENYTNYRHNLKILKALYGPTNQKA